VADDDNDPPKSGDGASPDADPDTSTDADKVAKREAAKAAAKAEARAKVEAAKPDDAGEATASAAEGESTALDRRDLPKWNRTRVKRKAPAGEEQDAFQVGVRQAGRGAVRRAPILLLAAVAVAGGIGGFIWWRGQAAAQAADATQMLATAAAYQARAKVEPNLDTVLGERARPPAQLLVKDEGELRQTIDAALADLESTAPKSDAAKLAQLVRAASAMRDGRFADGEAAFREFLASEPGHELAFLAQEGVLLAREAQGDIDGAIAEAETLVAADPATFYRDQALWHKGRMLEAQGKKDEALAVYRQYAEEYPLQDPSIARADVIGRLRELDPSAVPAGVEPEGPGPELDLGALLQ
jgi:tetratricopeptide (TPR) repeat protein